MNILKHLIDNDTVKLEENTEKIEKAKMEKIIDALSIQDKEDLIDLINYWREDGGAINYGSQENKDKWAPIHDFIHENSMVYLYHLSKDVLAEKAKFANEYNNKKIIEFIDKLLKRKKNEAVSNIYPETKDKEQKKKYSMIVNFYNQPKELQAIRQIFEQAIEGKEIQKEGITQRNTQNLQVEDLKKKLLGEINNN